MPASSALQNLRQTLYELRKIMPDITEPSDTSPIPFLLANRKTIQINPRYPFSVDTKRFSELLAHHPDYWGEAVARYRGDFLADFQLPDAGIFEGWAADRRADYKRQMLDAVTSLVDMHVERGAYEEAERLAQRQIAIDPLREKGHQQLMTVFALTGRRTEALQQFEKCRQLLDQQLALSVSQTTTDLVTTIRADNLPTPSRPQTQVGGYSLKEMIGSGNFGAVYRAVQTSIGREVAVKIIRDRYANDPEFIRRFEFEAQTVARLEHPHIVPLYDFWREPGSAYLVMRWLRGGSLADNLNGGWTLERTIPFVQQIGQALHAAHQRGIIHRDIKAANILLDENGNAYLSDFGVALAIADKHIDQTPTEMLLSVTSVSPEQVYNHPLTELSDIYSLGVLLYKLLTGKPPFLADSPAHLAQLHAHDPLPSLLNTKPELPAGLDTVIQKATAKQPENRYATAIEMVHAFQVAATNGKTQVAMPATMRTDIDNPYKGLQSFAEADAELFFGREALVTQLAEQITEHRFLALVGPSGSGKSSVVKAGLIPALRAGITPTSQDWFITHMLPGAHPFEELENALLRVAVKAPDTLLSQLTDGDRGLVRAVKRILPAGSGQQLLLLIDQFEELFTLVPDPAVMHHFLRSLQIAVTDSRTPIRVIVTLRADFYDKPLLIDGFNELMRQHTTVITPLNSLELTTAIRQPAALVGVEVEPDLVTTLVADVKNQTGALPLLQYALTELFEQRDGNTLTLSRYRELGGILGALSRRADAIYQAFSAPQQALTKQIFLRLVTLGEGVEDTRRRVRQTELASLASEEELATALDGFGSARLLSFDHDPVTRGPNRRSRPRSLVTRMGSLARLAGRKPRRFAPTTLTESGGRGMGK